MQRPITIAEHRQAIARLSAPSPKAVIRIDDGGPPLEFYTGAVDANDYTRRDGYAVLLQFGETRVDLYGWPEGDERSPQRLYD